MGPPLECKLMDSATELFGVNHNSTGELVVLFNQNLVYDLLGPSGFVKFQNGLICYAFEQHCTACRCARLI